MSKKYDLTGKRFGKLTVLEKIESKKYSSGRIASQWKCLCDCGNYHNAITTNLTSGKTTQCEQCSIIESGLKRRKNYIGQKFGKLTVKEMLYNYKGTGRAYCVCDCDCGNTDVIKEVYSITSGNIQSCGCIKGISQRESMTGNKYGKLKVLEEIFNSDGNHQVRCVCDCGNETIKNRHDVLTGHTLSCGCLQATGINKHNNKDYSGMISDYGVEILSFYGQNKNFQNLWNCKCGICGCIFQELPARILNNHVRSCGCLNRSSREELIENFLVENNIGYIPQYSFDDCKSNNNYRLRFDFAIFDQYDNLLFLIEYDGIQHFKPIEYFGGEKAYLDTVERDKIKNDYCKKNNILLLRLPYTYTEEQILNEIHNTLESVTTTGGI